MICTIYSHYIGFERITNIIKNAYPKAILKITTQEEFQIAEITFKGGLLSAASKIKIAYRQRVKPSYQLLEEDDCALSKNLKGLYGYVSSLPSKNEKVKDLFLHKILTLNCEFSVIQETGNSKELKSLIQSLADELDAILFVQPNTLISKSNGQHFLDGKLNLIIDGQGNCEINDLAVKIDAVYFDGDQEKISGDQKTRKLKSEKIIEDSKIKTNKNLPYIESEDSTIIRPVREIAQRVSILAMTNLVAFNTVSNLEVIEYLKKFGLWDFVTPKEKVFLANPTEEAKNLETWKCEGIWTLMWALKKVDNLGFPNELCSLKNIAANDYPISEGKDPNDFINSVHEIRNKSEILDANDLYYRLDWACVDARIKNTTLSKVNPGVVYERHYALNWLINYMNQDWDDISCDT